MSAWSWTIRVVLALTVLALISGYTYFVLRGEIAPADRIDSAHLVAIMIAAAVIAVLLLPNVFERIKGVEVYGLKLQVGEVRRQQEAQQQQLDDIRLLIGRIAELTKGGNGDEQ